MLNISGSNASKKNEASILHCLIKHDPGKSNICDNRKQLVIQSTKMH